MTSEFEFKRLYYKRELSVIAVNQTARPIGIGHFYLDLEKITKLKEELFNKMIDDLAKGKIFDVL